jgi:hypothetical protein
MHSKHRLPGPPHVVVLGRAVATPATQPVAPRGRLKGNGDVEIPSASPDVPPPRISAASAELIKPEWENTGALVVGRHLYDMTNAWGGRHQKRGDSKEVKRTTPDTALAGRSGNNLCTATSARTKGPVALNVSAGSIGNGSKLNGERRESEWLRSW